MSLVIVRLDANKNEAQQVRDIITADGSQPTSWEAELFGAPVRMKIEFAREVLDYAQAVEIVLGIVQAHITVVGWRFEL